MEQAIKKIVEVYLQSTKGKEQLGDKQFEKLIKGQLSNILTGTESSEAIKEMRKKLDTNEDKNVSFVEYMTLVGYLANTLSQQRTASKETCPAGEQDAAP